MGSSKHLETSAAACLDTVLAKTRISFLQKKKNEEFWLHDSVLDPVHQANRNCSTIEYVFDIQHVDRDPSDYVFSRTRVLDTQIVMHFRLQWSACASDLLDPEFARSVNLLMS